VTTTIAVAWTRTWTTRALALVLAIPLLLHLASADAALWNKLLTLGLLVLSFTRPSSGLVALAAILPLAPFAGLTPDRADAAASAFVVPVLLGAFLRVSPERAPAVRWPAVPIFGLLVLISAAAAPWRLWFERGVDGFPMGHAAVIWIEALALAALAARLARAHATHGATAVRALIAGASIAAIASAVAFWQLVSRDPASTSAATALLTVRLAPHFSDVNTAGSYVALFVVAALYLCLLLSQLSQLSRWLGWAVAAAPLVLALWLTGSRTALASAVVLGTATWIASRHRRRALLAAVVVLALAVVGYLTFATPTRVPQASPGYALHVRVEMAKVALQMAAAHPINGVGIGRFQQESRAWISPSLATLFPPAAAGENAHNNFLQVMAEVGVPGLAAFCWMLAGPALLGWQSIRRGEARPELKALGAGTLAFLLTCFAGHPLLSTHVVFTFFFAAGLIRGLAERSEIH
jgi:O-antigen ligase